MIKRVQVLNTREVDPSPNWGDGELEIDILTLDDKGKLDIGFIRTTANRTDATIDWVPIL